MTPSERRAKRLLDGPVDPQHEWRDLKEGQWYRRGPPCGVCGDIGWMGVLFDGGPDDKPSIEYCAICTSAIDVTHYGPKQTGRVRVVFPPDSDVPSENPYLTPPQPMQDTRQDFDVVFADMGTTDLANARRLALRFGERVRYTQGWGWLVWDGRRWLRDELGTVERMAKHVVDYMRDLTEKDDLWKKVDIERAKFVKHAETSQSRGKIEAMVALAQSEPDISAKVDDFDQESWLLNCKNGTVDLTTGTLYPHDTEMCFTQLVPHDGPSGIDAAATPDCPRWLAFLNEITCGDVELQDFLQRAVGYTLTGDVREQKLFFLYGDGANGKSTFLEVIRHVLGDYSTHLSFEALLKSRSSTPEQGFAHLPGKRFATASEAGEGRAWNEEAVKAVTGGDTLRAKFLYKDTFEFRPVCKIWVAANDRPRIEGVNEGIWRRFFLVPFLAEIPPERRDPGLLDALKAEAPGILAWAVRGSMRWYREGLKNVPKAIKDAFEEYRTDNDSLSRWIEDRCQVGLQFSATPNDLLRSYNEWAKENNERPLTQTMLGRRLAKWRGGRLRKQKSSTVRWDGIALKSRLGAEEGLSGGLDSYP